MGFWSKLGSFFKKASPTLLNIGVAVLEDKLDDGKINGSQIGKAESIINGIPVEGQVEHKK